MIGRDTSSIDESVIAKTVERLSKVLERIVKKSELEEIRDLAESVELIAEYMKAQTNAIKPLASCAEERSRATTNLSVVVQNNPAAIKSLTDRVETLTRAV